MYPAKFLFRYFSKIVLFV